ncbi:MAG: peptidylprolyl isomerase [Bacilli bacterium]
MKKVLISLMAITLLVSGCGKVPKLKDGKEAVVTLKGEDISVDDLYKEIKDKYAISILIDKIDLKILNKKYPSDDTESKKINDQITAMRAQFQNDEAKFIDAVKQAFGVDNLNDLKKILVLDYKRGKAIEAYVNGLITDKEISEYYDNKTIGDIKASHILIKVEITDGMTAAQKEDADKAALKIAKEVISKYKNGEKFADLAKQYSDDEASAAKGGNLDYFNRGSMVKPFEDAAIKLEKGKYTLEPVKSDFGYHIILKTDQKKKPSLKTVKSEIKKTLREEKLKADKKLQIKALIQLRKDNNVKIQDSELNNQYDKIMENLLNQKEETK